MSLISTAAVNRYFARKRLFGHGEIPAEVPRVGVELSKKPRVKQFCEQMGFQVNYAASLGEFRLRVA